MKKGAKMKKLAGRTWKKYLLREGEKQKRWIWKRKPEESEKISRNNRANGKFETWRDVGRDLFISNHVSAHVGQPADQKVSSLRKPMTIGVCGGDQYSEGSLWTWLTQRASYVPYSSIGSHFPFYRPAVEGDTLRAGEWQSRGPQIKNEGK